MDTRHAPPEGNFVNSGLDGPTVGATDWRSLLRRRAETLWRNTVETAAVDDVCLSAVTRALGPLADDAVKAVEAYAIGARQWSPPESTPARFSSRLDLILKGIEASADARLMPVAAEESAQPHVIQSELWQVLHKVRESAELSYSREQYLIELDRRLLFLLQNAGALVPADISSAVGVDKAQVSRSVKRLLEMRLVEREQIRAPLRLTRDGERLGKRLSRMAELRNRELTIDISEAELAEFFEAIEILLDRAIALYDQERALVQGGKSTEPSDRDDEDKQAEKVVIDRSRIIAPLMTLSAYFSRSGALAFKRLTGLSTFEAFVLSEIGMNPPIEWSALVAALARDHSQAARTVNALVERGLVSREGKPGRRHGRFYPSDEGQKLVEVIQEAGRQRSTFLLAPLEPAHRARFLSTFDKVRRNAVAQLARERAFAEIDRA
ncbi:MarR family transcriptional regulator [Croceibacterium sp. LX-88]|uniref:MarR family transcriptional regulator n=1 Tax=Croceibacterium selenioxidans TaxID=2838833 RepID=A0ABS5W1N7_9SPHN|nr:MarR family transcriptional regulator [Croceibacterium selenioxidans]MBT2133661.1 MarR family transcriptional regulator [Croceibacterium selenioxidans]